MKIIRRMLLKAAGGVPKEELEKVRTAWDAERKLNANPTEFDVKQLILKIGDRAIRAELGLIGNPNPRVSDADIIETRRALEVFACQIENNIHNFVHGMCEKDATCTRWGVPNVKTGVSYMMSICRGTGLLADFARIWAKEHKDTRQKDVLAPAQIAQWRKYDKNVRKAINLAVGFSNMVFWKQKGEDNGNVHDRDA